MSVIKLVTTVWLYNSIMWLLYEGEYELAVCECIDDVYGQLQKLPVFRLWYPYLATSDSNMTTAVYIDHTDLTDGMVIAVHANTQYQVFRETEERPRARWHVFMSDEARVVTDVAKMPSLVDVNFAVFEHLHEYITNTYDDIPSIEIAVIDHAEGIPDRACNVWYESPIEDTIHTRVYVACYDGALYYAIRQ